MCFVFVIYVVIKLSIFDISSDKFDDTRWIKVHGSVLDGASSFLVHRAFKRVNFQTDRSSSDP